DAPAEHRREGLRDRGLPGAGRPEEEDRAPAVDRGTELAKSFLGQDETVERLADLVEGDLHAADGLRANAIAVRGLRDRRGPAAGVRGERFARPLLALRGGRVVRGRRRRAPVALDLDAAV